VGVQEMRCEKDGIEKAEHYTFLMEKEIRTIGYGHVFFIHKKIISAVRKVEFISDRMSYTTL
jgi:hypothetical protein